VNSPWKEVGRPTIAVYTIMRNEEPQIRRWARSARDADALFLAKLTGPGKVWLQSLPLSRLADRLYKAAPQTGHRKEEGSVLDMVGGLGKLIDGD